MQIQKLTAEQKQILRWRKNRNKIAKRILLNDKTISTEEAFRLANKKAGPMPGSRVRW